jgi:RNA polymerase sigma-70 factor, ECF subfamily
MPWEISERDDETGYSIARAPRSRKEDIDQTAMIGRVYSTLGAQPSPAGETIARRCRQQLNVRRSTAVVRSVPMLTDPRSARLRLCSNELPLEQRDDDELMLLTGAGMKAAFEELLRRHQRAVRSYCARVCRDVGVAEDAAQEVFVTLWRSRQSYEPKGCFRSYLFTIAVSRCKNELRRGKVMRFTADGTTQAAIDPLALDAMVAAERSQRLYGLVNRLPEAQRVAITLRFAAGLEYGEIADVARGPEATVRSRVFLGLKHLRKLMGKRGEP